MSDELKTFTVDASKEGCTGMFWRTEPKMGSTSMDNSWPRNGTVLKGRYVADHPGWVQFENGFWLPVEQNGFTVVHESK